MKVVAIVQARIGSTRLPGKVLKDISGKPMLWYLISRLKYSTRTDDLVLAIPESRQNDQLEDFAQRHKLHYFRGSEEDVLARYYGAATKFGAEVIVRLTADCPLIDPEVTDRIIEEHLSSGADYTSNTMKRTFPRGLDTEVFSFQALHVAYQAAREDYEREHVTPYIYQHPDLFRLKSVEANGKLRRPDLRLTVDTGEDLRLIKEIFHRLYHKNQVFPIEEVINLLDKHPELAAISANVRQKGFDS